MAISKIRRGKGGQIVTKTVERRSGKIQPRQNAQLVVVVGGGGFIGGGRRMGFELGRPLAKSHDSLATFEVWERAQRDLMAGVMSGNPDQIVDAIRRGAKPFMKKCREGPNKLPRMPLSSSCCDCWPWSPSTRSRLRGCRLKERWMRWREPGDI